ncbi:hypothetical protein KKF34_02600 [Myxococcota bacterium]|nr:hypothetical protein [Myxococcota bacterium]MBU1380943.1 hypothetical protein [Myxococcota bacterium]MBU1495752.1 hypothetical protein [Myxococcota bacterium]
MKKLILTMVFASLLLSCEDEKIDPMCGDSKINQESEECDRIDFENSCVDLGYYGGEIACTTSCTVNIDQCILAGRCGDGSLQADHEECDGLEFAGVNGSNGDDCTSHGYGSGTVSCTEDCKFDLSECDSCGNEQLDLLTGEECDGIHLGDGTCYLEGMWGGELGCSSSCEYELENCTFATNPITGEQHSCILNDKGELLCLGKKLGGSTSDSKPEKIAFTENVAQVVSGSAHVCFLDAVGDTWCLGEGADYRLGTGDYQDQLAPVKINAPGQIFTKLSAGASATCGINGAGELYCWGTLKRPLEDFFQNTTPQQITFDEGNVITKVSVGDVHMCVIDTDGAAFCWGNNSGGKLGNGQSGFFLTDSFTPVAVLQSEDYVDIAACQEHTCAIDINGDLWCWGKGSDYELGTGGTDDSAQPVLVDAPSGVEFVKVMCSISELRQTGYSGFTCALSSVGDLYCWGDNYNKGRLGNNGAATFEPLPAMVHQSDFNLRWQDFYVGTNHVCAVDMDGRPWCWGDDTNKKCGGDAIGVYIAPVALMP